MGLLGWSWGAFGSINTCSRSSAMPRSRALPTRRASNKASISYSLASCMAAKGTLGCSGSRPHAAHRAIGVRPHKVCAARCKHTCKGGRAVAGGHTHRQRQLDRREGIFGPVQLQTPQGCGMRAHRVVGCSLAHRRPWLQRRTRLRVHAVNADMRPLARQSCNILFASGATRAGQHGSDSRLGSSNPACNPRLMQACASDTLMPSSCASRAYVQRCSPQATSLRATRKSWGLSCMRHSVFVNREY
jgi:hypothetical protein